MLKDRLLHFIGIGGMGMSGLACLSQDLGCEVTGSDETDSKTIDLLRRRGILVTIGHAAENIERPDRVVFSSAIEDDNIEYSTARSRGIPLYRRGIFLAEFASSFSQCIAIAGSHGKSTVTAMLVHILRNCGRSPSYLVGAYFLDHTVPAKVGREDLFITEVDESDGSQSLMYASHAVIVNVDDDHFWSLGGKAELKQCFQHFADNSEYLLVYDSKETRRLFAQHPNVDFFSSDLVRDDLQLCIPGHHNRLNASLALHMAVTQYSLDESDALAAIQTFKGIDRRLSIAYTGDGISVIDDYAHHPAEIRASLQAVREQYPGQRIRVIFQPHRFERVKYYSRLFAETLSQADDVYITPIFSAWTDSPIDDHIHRICSAIQNIPAQYWKGNLNSLAEHMSETSRKGDLIIIMGAGDIDRLQPILLERLQEKSY